MTAHTLERCIFRIGCGIVIVGELHIIVAVVRAWLR